MNRPFIDVWVVLAVFVACAWTGTARAQCEPRWLPGEQAPGVDRTVCALTV